MHEMILLTARHTTAVYNQTANMPLLSELIGKQATMTLLMRRTTLYFQLFYMIMYHSIIGSAFRIAICAKEDWEICEPSPRYTKGSGLFICESPLMSYIVEKV